LHINLPNIVANTTPWYNQEL